nr:hypothetical protein [Bacillus pumilus]
MTVPDAAATTDTVPFAAISNPKWFPPERPPKPDENRPASLV